MTQGSKRYKGVKYLGNTNTQVEDDIVMEEPLQVNVNGKPFTVTMRTPGSDDALVTGLLYTEGIYEGSYQLKIKTLHQSDSGFPAAVNVWIPPEKLGSNYYQARSLLSVSSCGICGKRELSELFPGDEKLHPPQKLNPVLMPGMFDEMSRHQHNFVTTGGSHAAGAFTINGELLAVEEDIGRHNAVDKVIGNLFLSKKLENVSCMLVSGRVSFEIVSKTYKAGIPFLAAVSSPSSLSIETANAMGITLMAFCRGETLTSYTHVEQLVSVEKNKILTP